jgi:hypothetical protein
VRIVENCSRHHHLDDLSVVLSKYLTLHESLSNAYFLNSTFEHALQHNLIFMDLDSRVALISHQMVSGFPGVHKQPNWLQVFQESTNNPMDSGVPGIYELPNQWLQDFQDSSNNPMPGLTFSRNSRTTQWLAPAFPEIHEQPNGLLQLFQKFTNNPMACSSFSRNLLITQ